MSMYYNIYSIWCQCCSPILFLLFVYGHIFVRYVETGQPMSTQSLVAPRLRDVAA